MRNRLILPISSTQPERAASAGSGIGDVEPAWYRALVWLGLGAGVAGMIALANRAPQAYDSLVQEDRFIEWWSAVLFVAAAGAHAARARRRRSRWPLLVALFCLTAAGEETSWGQRLVGFTPPEAFLATNYQQEFNLHNFAALLGRPKWTLIACLLAYGLALPLVAASAGRRVPAWARAAAAEMAPPLLLVPWFLAAVVLLIWYPVEMTAEWVEAMTGGLFLLAAGPPGWWPLAAILVALFPASALTAAGDARRADPKLVRCAANEVAALRDAIATGAAGAERLLRMRSSHRRVWSLSRDSSLRAPPEALLAAASCAPGAADGARRRYAVDPWGTAYWIRLRRPRSGERSLTVYSFGPNRRRDEGARGDDLRADTVLSTRRAPLDQAAKR